ncbi:MAG: type IV pilus modification PilV family protein [Pseudomonadota bacterium]
MYENTHRRQRGMSLIEVFVALLVLSVGLIALARLQVDLVRGGSDARTRSVALALAEEKVEDLRTFAVTDGSGTWSTTASPMAWSYVDGPALATPADTSCTACTGGRIAPQTTYSSALEVAGVRFKRTWEVDNRDFTGTGPITSRTKDVRVTVAWLSELGVEQQVSVLANVVEIPPGNVALASEPVSERPPGPQVLYTPGLAPEVIAVPIDVGGNKKRETTKPLPDVVGNSGTHIVTFDVVNYQNGVVEQREEFATLNCTCSMGTVGSARTPARSVFQNGNVVDVPGRVVQKMRGTYSETGSSFDDLCVTCCRDHFDYSEDGVDYRYNPTDPNNPHRHYNMPSPTPVTSGQYHEACRMKRVNGVFAVFEDWQLADVTLLPGSFLTDLTSQLAYTTYVQNVIKDKVLNTSTATKPTGRDTSVLSGGFNQLFGRAIYIDLPAGMATFIQNQVNGGADFINYLDMIPFYEINLTKLADWSSMNNPVVRVTGSDIKTELENQDEYSRGRAEGNAPVTTPDTVVRVITSLARGNTGVTGTAAISPSEDGRHPRTLAQTVGSGQNVKKYFATAQEPETPPPAEHMDDSILVTFQGTAPPPPPPPPCTPDPCPPPPPPPPPPPSPVEISGDLFKWDGASGNNKPHLDVTGVSFVGTTGNISGTCTLRKNGNNADFTCTVPSGWSGDVRFAPSSLTYCTASSCSAVAPTTVLFNDQRSYTNVTTGLGEEDTWVKN